MAAYFELKRYIECKSDIERYIIIHPEDKYALIGMLEYLDCKIKTEGDCGDSIFGNEKVLTITVDTCLNNEVEIEENSQEQVDSAIIELFSE